MKSTLRTLPLAAFVLALAGVGAAVTVADEPAVERHTELKLVLDHDGAAERIELEDLHDLAVGESRSFTTESGKAVLATRTEEGFEIDVEGKKITIAHPGSATFVGGDGKVVVFEKKIESGDGEATKTMVWSSAGDPGEEHVRILHKSGLPGEGDAFAFATGDGKLAFPFSAEDWITRLEGSAKFQALDAATRETVKEALREVAPKHFAGHRKVVVLDVDDRETKEKTD